MIIHNDGPHITATDCFQSEHARLGLVYCSTNARCFRLLVPPGAPQVDPAGAQYVIVTRGKWVAQGWREAVEFVWEDGSKSPYHVLILAEQCDLLPSPEDEGRTDLRCVGYGPDLAVLWDLPARYRRVPRLPCLKPWEAH